MKRALSAVLVLAMAQSALAESRKVLVLPTEGRTDAGTRAKIDAAVLKLAKTAGADVTAGELTYTDAAAAVGCKPEERTCKDDVLGMLSVDELVYTTVMPKPGGLGITVHRVGKGGITHEAQLVVATGQQPDDLDGLAPLFGGTAATKNPPTPGPASPPTGTPAISTGSTGPSGPTGPDTASPETTPPPAPLPPVTHDPGPSTLPPVSSTPEQPEGEGGHRKLELIGMITGGAFVVLSFALWADASSISSDIDSQVAMGKDKTRVQLDHIRDLESQGDGAAGLGNLLFLGGLVIGGVSGYFYWRDHRSHRSTSASITPAVFEHGAGIAWGGSL